MRQSLRIIAGLLILVSVQAGPILKPAHEAVADNCLGRNSPGPHFCDISTNVIQKSTNGGVVSVRGSYGSSAIEATLTASATAKAEFGVLHAGSSATFSIAGTPGHATGHAVARFDDIITINCAPFTGQAGILILEYALDGTTTSSGAAVGLGSVTVLLGSTLQQHWDTAYTGPVAGKFRHTFTFTYGEPFGLRVFLGADAGTVFASSGRVLTRIASVGSGSASASFFNTLILSGLIVEDQDGNPVSGATFTSASGTVYGPNGVVP